MYSSRHHASVNLWSIDVALDFVVIHRSVIHQCLSALLIHRICLHLGEQRSIPSLLSSLFPTTKKSCHSTRSMVLTRRLRRGAVMLPVMMGLR